MEVRLHIYRQGQRSDAVDSASNFPTEDRRVGGSYPGLCMQRLVSLDLLRQETLHYFVSLDSGVFNKSARFFMVSDHRT